MRRRAESTYTERMPDRSITMPSSPKGSAAHIVSSAANCGQHVLGARKVHGRNDVGHAGAAGDEARTLVDARIPDSTGTVITSVCGFENLPVK